MYLHLIFAVQARLNLIRPEFQEELEKYITGIITNRNQKLIAINAMPDHLHLLIGIKPDIRLSDLVRDIKTSSTKFIQEHRWVKGKFSWQEGFGAFSYSHSQLNSVIAYIQNQQKHHTKKSFQEEYLTMLQKFNISFNAKYIFNFIEKD